MTPGVAPAAGAARETGERGGRNRNRRRPRGHQGTDGAIVPGLPPRGTRRILLVNATETGEIRVAILEDGELAEIFIERKSRRQHTGNIYKARVVNVEPSLQAAFVDLGTERNGFLHASDCIPPDGGCGLLAARASSVRPAAAPPAPAPVPEPAAAPSAEADDDDRQPASLTRASAPAGTGVAALESEEGPQPGNTLEAVPSAAVPAKKRRRRRGGRGRSGRGRVVPPQARMLSPDPEGGPDPEPPESGDLEEPVDAEEEAEVPPLPPASEAEEPAEPSEERAPAPAPEVAPETEQAGLQPGALEGGAERGDESPAAEGPARRESRRFGGNGGNGRSGRSGHERRYLIQEMLHRGQEIVVQVSKEGMGQKGAGLTTYLSLPGRYLVLMPAVQRLGVSKRIESEEQRRELKEILAGLQVPEGMGVIVRTAGMGRRRDELERDLEYLNQNWDTLRKKAQAARAPALLYEEGDVVTRVFRDVWNDDVTEVVVDDALVQERARAFLREISPGAEDRVRLYTEREPLFHRYGVEQQYQRLFNRKVPLRGGGSIVIEQTEALVAIDVNTGRFREKRNQDDTILATNLEAAREIARQLRLRDIGGLVMIDFIDMDHMEHRRQVEREFRAHLARDKARLNVLPISSLGIVEMTRQRIRHSLRKTLFEVCPQCQGTGHLRSHETMGLELLRELRSQALEKDLSRIRVVLHPAAALGISNLFRRELTKLEDSRGLRIEVQGDAACAPTHWQVFGARESGDWILKQTCEGDDYVRNS